jgi:hypothetical protein
MCVCGQAISLSKGLVTSQRVLKRRWHDFEHESVEIQSQLLDFSDILQSNSIEYIHQDPTLYRLCDLLVLKHGTEMRT